MPFNGSGIFTRLYNFVADATALIPARPDRFDAELNGFATGLSNCITADGQGKPVSAINFNNQNLTNVNLLGVVGTSSFGGTITIAGDANANNFLTPVTVATIGSTTGTYIQAYGSTGFSGTTNTLAFTTNSVVRFVLDGTGAATFSGNVTVNANITTNNLFTADAGASVGAVSGTNIQIYGSTAGGGNANTFRFLTGATLRYTLATKLTASGAGVVPNFASAAMTGGAIFVQAVGTDPTSAPGDIVFEY